MLHGSKRLDVWRNINFLKKTHLERDLEAQWILKPRPKLGFVLNIRPLLVADRDRQIRGSQCPKNFFSALRASVSSKNQGEVVPPGPIPWIRHCLVIPMHVVLNYDLACESRHLFRLLFHPLRKEHLWSRAGKRFLWVDESVFVNQS